jgi:hypothetical protein
MPGGNRINSGEDDYTSSGWEAYDQYLVTAIAYADGLYEEYEDAYDALMNFNDAYTSFRDDLSTINNSYVRAVTEAAANPTTADETEICDTMFYMFLLPNQDITGKVYFSVNFTPKVGGVAIGRSWVIRNRLTNGAQQQDSEYFIPSASSPSTSPMLSVSRDVIGTYYAGGWSTGGAILVKVGAGSDTGPITGPTIDFNF